MTDRKMEKWKRIVAQVYGALPDASAFREVGLASAMAESEALCPIRLDELQAVTSTSPGIEVAEGPDGRPHTHNCTSCYYSAPCQRRPGWRCTIYEQGGDRPSYQPGWSGAPAMCLSCVRELLGDELEMDVQAAWENAYAQGNEKERAALDMIRAPHHHLKEIDND